MDDYQRANLEFKKVFDQPIQDKPQISSEEDTILAAKLIDEETKEVFLAMMEKDLAHISKELADLLFVTFGAANTYGVEIWPIYKAVFESNLTKVWPDGSVRRREDGKILKPGTYQDPDIERLLVEQGYESSTTEAA